ncbi:cyclase family protein [Anianabacter salinae]|uniref:cyclase family protein n=1 Tax=Anianabacter salinae TaxID=2851023 RepID=UPI00225E612B|nr:cyclase family protein [Anianabacter salinae]MBV0911840.1 cyclase family protein [Anianabacter salinae]
MTTQRWKNRPEGSNWGDFGPDDQIGRMNLVTPEARLSGAREIREGLSFCLSLPLDYPGGNVLFPLRKEPVFHHEKRGDGHNFNFDMSALSPCYCDVVSDDAVTLYTQYSTQWDALAHVGMRFDADGDGEAEKVYYNGYRGGEDIVGPDDGGRPNGAAALGIENLAASGVQGRGVMVDLERSHGRDRVLIDYDALMKAMDGNDTDIAEGDFLCLNTGFADLVLSMKKQPDGEVLGKSCAVLDGRDTRLLNWITDSGIAAICADNFAVEAYPARTPEGERFPALPLHNHCLFKLGIHLGELWNFSELARWLRENGRSAFFLTAPPLRLPGSVGSPVTPVATV